MKQAILSILLVFLPMLACAETVEINGIYYNLNTETKQAIVTGNTSRIKAEVNILEKITYQNIEYSVTSIGNSAFNYCYGMISVSIPSSVNSIGKYAFSGCSRLAFLSIPKSVTNIGPCAFSDCTALASIKVESGNPSYESPDDCNAIIEKSSNTLILGCMGSIIPNSVTSIGNDAFSGCSGLTTLTIPNSVNSIGEKAFNNCRGLTSLTIPASVMSIGNSAFNGCTGLTTLMSEIENPYNIDASVFNGISGNAQLIVPKTTLTAYQEAEGWNVFTNIAEIDGASDGTSAVTVEINGINYYLNPSSKQASLAFDYNKKYKGFVRIPEKVTYNKIEYSVTSLGGAFDGSRDLISVTIPNSVTAIGEACFYNCSSLISLTIPANVTSIEYRAFYGCSSQLSLYITDLEAWCKIIFDNPIGSYRLFLNGKEIKDLVIPNGTTSISSYAFSGCTGLTSIVIPRSVTYIGSNVFSGYSGKAPIIIPSSVTTIEGNIYGGCTASISLEDGNPKYDSRDHCNAIIETKSNTLISGNKNTVIPNSVTAIGSYAFSGCTDMTSVTIPSSVTTIGNYAFSGCSGLTSIVLENSNPISGNNLFPYQIYNKAALIVPAGTKAAYQSAEEWGKFQNIIEAGEGGTVGQEFVADGILYKIGENNTVSVIEDKSMKNKSGAIVIANQVMFNGIAYQVTSIGNSAFEWCDRLTSITIPNSVTSIGANAFGGCILKRIISEIESPFSIDESVFKGVPSNAKVIVPEGAKAKYLAVEGWNRFTNIIEKNSPEGAGNNEEDDDFNAFGTPLTFEAFEGTVTVDVRNYFCSNRGVIQYRVDDGPWTDFTLNNTECYGTPRYSNFIPAGKIVQLRCNDWPYMLNRLDESSQGDGYSIQCDADCYVYGNVMSLETYYYATDYDKECSLGWLFYQNTHVKNHPTKPLVLPSKTLGASCYTGMFYGCTGLTGAPELPATELNGNAGYPGGCYESMFQGCTSLTVAPVLPASVLTESCYKNMFKGCMNLNAVTCYATDISANDATQNWLSGVSSTGTFTKLPSMTAWGEGASGIPYGWNVAAGSSQGDVNGDNRVGLEDAMVILSYILGEKPIGFNVTAADMNGDGEVTITDILIILDSILKQ